MRSTQNINICCGPAEPVPLTLKVKQGINISRFWKEIAKMNFAPFILSISFIYAMYDTIIESWSKLALWIFIYTITYIVLLYKVSMNQYERTLLMEPIKKIVKR